MDLEVFTRWMSFCVGLVVGSFVNVVVARLPHRVSVVSPRSRCPHCGQGIAWYDNIPIFSFLFLRARCRHCRTSISFRYPLIELMTGILFVAAQVKFGFSPLLLVRDWPWLAILMAVTFIDLDHRLIPDPLSLGGLVLGLLTCWIHPAYFEAMGWFQSVSGALLGFGSFYLLAWTYEKFAGRPGLGGGDIKLLAMIGAFLGPHGVLITVLISSVLGSLIGVGWAMMTRASKASQDLMKVAIPYGPFLVMGALYYYFLGDLFWFTL